MSRVPVEMFSGRATRRVPTLCSLIEGGGRDALFLVRHRLQGGEGARPAANGGGGGGGGGDEDHVHLRDANTVEDEGPRRILWKAHEPFANIEYRDIVIDLMHLQRRREFQHIWNEWMRRLPRAKDVALADRYEEYLLAFERIGVGTT